jgi:TetR/AcrR family transcriptional repressor of nem operon
MARPREFDDVAVLDRAIDCFWAHGFAATSIRALSDEMGISGPSLYNAFGDKHGLFMQAIERYLDRTMRERIARLEGSMPPADAVRAFFAEVVRRALGDPDRRGCFLLNVALERADDPALADSIAGYLGEIESFFRRQIAAGQADGSIAEAQSATDLARMLLGVILGLRVIARVNPSRALIEGMARTALAALDPPRRRRKEVA